MHKIDDVCNTKKLDEITITSDDLFAIGRICDQKNTITMVELLIHILKINPRLTTRLFFAGTIQKAELDKIRARINQLDARHLNLEERIVFLGSYIQSEVFSYAKQSNAIVPFCSFYETFGLVAAEALGNGVPVALYATNEMMKRLYADIYPSLWASGKIAITTDDWYKLVIKIKDDAHFRGHYIELAHNDIAMHTGNAHLEVYEHTVKMLARVTDDAMPTDSLSPPAQTHTAPSLHHRAPTRRNHRWQ